MDNGSLKFGIVAVAMMFAGLFGGAVEGHLFPVATKADIIQFEPSENSATRIWGEFVLLRPGCDFAGIEWVLNGENRSVAVQVVFEQGAVVRSSGAQGFGPWAIQLTPDQLFNASTATVFHKCPWRYWETETAFY